VFSAREFRAETSSYGSSGADVQKRELMVTSFIGIGAMHLDRPARFVAVQLAFTAMIQRMSRCTSKPGRCRRCSAGCSGIGDRLGWSTAEPITEREMSESDRMPGNGTGPRCADGVAAFEQITGLVRALLAQLAGGADADKLPRRSEVCCFCSSVRVYSIGSLVIGLHLSSGAGNEQVQRRYQTYPH